MKIIINGKSVEVPSGSGSSITMDDVNAAINEAVSSAMEKVYSKEEIRIGTWIDGKPLYRIVLQGRTPSSAGTTGAAVATTTNNKHVKNMYGMWEYSGSTYVLPINLPGIPGQENVSVRCWYRNGYIEMATTNSAYTNKPCWIVLEYTKTTD